MENTINGRETLRKIRKIEQLAGADWRDKFPDRSVSSVFYEVTGDDREIIFARVAPEVKTYLYDLSDDWECTLAETIEDIILGHH